jgi:dTDP-4-amino-4,6-dideoxygalactose transaminase
VARKAESSGPIPFTLPSMEGREQAYVAEVVAFGRLAGDGPFTVRCQDLLESTLGVGKALLTTSCTSALEMTALLLDIGPGDEVIVPSFTFVSCANAFVLRGARPVFADIRRDTLNLDETRLEALITPRTRAIVVVHYGGVGCEMDEILAIAARQGVPVVEDNAHGLFGTYRGRPLGTFGTMATLSFHETKNITCGEGGALLLNDPDLAGRAEVIREKGTDRSRFFRGQVDKYTWIDLGSSYLLSDILAAVLFGQLEERVAIQARRRRVWQHYADHLAGWAAAEDIRLPTVPAHVEHPYHLFYLLLPNLEERQRLIAHLRARYIQSAFHYQPLHLSRMGRQFGGREGECPVTEWASDCLLRLPFYNHLEKPELDRVVSAITEFRVAS